jgi:hypothetical protein
MFLQICSAILKASPKLDTCVEVVLDYGEVSFTTTALVVDHFGPNTAGNSGAVSELLRLNFVGDTPEWFRFAYAEFVAPCRQRSSFRHIVGVESGRLDIVPHDEWVAQEFALNLKLQKASVTCFAIEWSTVRSDMLRKGRQSSYVAIVPPTSKRVQVGERAGGGVGSDDIDWASAFDARRKRRNRSANVPRSGTAPQPKAFNSCTFDQPHCMSNLIHH